MAIWIITFEIITLLFFITSVIRVLMKKDYRALSTIIAGAIFGVVLEYFNIYFSHGYFYSQDFIFLVGKAPTNVPIVIGLSWGMLLELSHEVSQCFHLPLLFRTIFEAAFIVSIDLFADIVAVRLDGGFWIWTNHPVTLSITNTDFMGIAYGNYYGWYFVIFLSSFILHIFDLKFEKSDFLTLGIRTIICIVGAELLLLPVLMLVQFFMNWVWLVFLLMYIGSLVSLIVYFISKKEYPIKEQIPDYFPFIYFVFHYLFNIIAMIYLQLAIQIPLYFVLNILYTVGIIFLFVKLSYFEKRKEKLENNSS
ncbi:hypothetical protein [Candidatus Harpocratesius sp.]